MSKVVSDFYWLKNRTRYTCPLLMALTVWYYRVIGFNCRWFLYDDYAGSGHGAYVAIKQGRGGYEPSCIFPKWMILLECKIHNLLICVRGFHGVSKEYGFVFALRGFWSNLKPKKR